MRIMEEVVRQQNPFTSHGSAIASKLKEQQEIDRLRKEFLQRGGKVDVIEPPKPKACIPSPKPIYGMYSDMEEKRQKAQAKQRKVKATKLKYINNRKRPQVIINGFYLGSYDTTEQAVEARDRYLECNNLPPVNQL
jgi:hypothetical protein